MRKHWKKFIAALFLSWLCGAATIALYLFQYSAEDFSAADLIPFLLTLAVFGGALSFIAFAVMIRLSKRLKGFPYRLAPLLAGAALVTLPVAVFAGFRAFVFQNLPVVEFVLFTGAFSAQGLALGLAFLQFYRESNSRPWLTSVAYAVIAIGSIFVIQSLILPVSEAALQSETNGVITDSVKMSVPRSAHTATLLADGRILLVGGMISVTGQETPTAATEIYDPRTNTVETGAQMLVPRAGHTATLLENGDVLITGGVDEKQSVASAELYRAASSDFVRLGAMHIARERHSATKLKNGTVLITGGTVAEPSREAEIYYPQTQTFRRVPPMTSRRAAQTSTLLADGRVLIAGGSESLSSVLRSTEIYDPQDDAFKPVGEMQVNRYKHSAVLLADGRVLLVGGADERDWSGRRSSVEIYDPAKNTSQTVGAMNRARFKIPGAAVLSVDGKVIVLGSGRRAEVFDKTENNFRVGAGSFEDEWFYSTATALPDGRVFIAGGYNSSLIPTQKTWLYQPPS